MNLKEDKDKIVEMLISEDTELRSLAVNSIRNNYDTDFKYAYSYSINDGISLKISKDDNKKYFNMNCFLESIIYTDVKQDGIREKLDLIIEYNELKGRQR